MKKRFTNHPPLLLLSLLLVGCLMLTACQTNSKNIKSYISNTEEWRSTTDKGTLWTIRCYVETQRFDSRNVDNIVVNINGKNINAIIPSNFGVTNNYFEVEYLDTKNSTQAPKIRSCYAYFSADAGNDNSGGIDIQTTDLTVIIILGASLLVIGGVLHFVAVTSGISILTRIPGAIFLICVIGAFAFSVTEGLVMIAFFVAYLIACRLITKFFLD